MSFSDKFSGENRDFPGDNKAFRRKKANCKGTGDVVGWRKEGGGGMEIRIERREELSILRYRAQCARFLAVIVPVGKASLAEEAGILLLFIGAKTESL